MTAGVREIDAFPSGEAVNRIIGETKAEYLLWFHPGSSARLYPESIGRFLQVAEATGAGMVYADYAGHPVMDYQWGSIRDTFDFGPVSLISVPAARRCFKKFGAVPDIRYGGLYDLRLKMSCREQLFHIPETLSEKIMPETGGSMPETEHFAYVDPRHRPYQLEMERIATEHLKRVGAFLEPAFRPLPEDGEVFPVTASVIIPVRNRRPTIGQAVESALGQTAGFAFNVIVVDNHSTDGTTDLLGKLAGKCKNVKHIVPGRTDLGIGGCWHEAIRSPWCGRYAVQLDSDDLYGRTDTLQQMVDILQQGAAAMAIGSYTIVNENLEAIPPGLIDHREWTDENGRNNALRINGLGAPRAFVTSLIRRIGFPNVSYGEDYAVALRLCREYRIARLYESLYLCRRWAGNTDAALPVETANRYDAYKDALRTVEILARQKLNRQKKMPPERANAR